MTFEADGDAEVEVDAEAEDGGPEPSRPTLGALAAEVGAALAPLAVVFDNPAEAVLLLEALGWEAPDTAASLALALSEAGELLDALIALASADEADRADRLEMASRYGELLAAIQRVVAAVTRGAQALRGSAALPPGYLAATGIDELLPRRLLDYLVIRYVSLRAPTLHAALMLLGVFDLQEMPAETASFQTEHTRRTIHPERAELLLSDPGRIFREVHGWGTADFDATLLLGRVADLARALGARTRSRNLPREVEERLMGGAVPEAAQDPVTQIFASMARWRDDNDLVDVGLSGFVLRPGAAGGADGGLAFLPYAIGEADHEIPLGGPLSFVIEAGLELVGGLALALRPGQPARLVTGLDVDSPLQAMVDGRLGFGLRHASGEIDEETGEPIRLILMSLGGASLAAQAVSVIGGGRVRGGEVDPFVEVTVTGARLSLGMADVDSLVADLVGSARQVAVDVDLLVGWSAQRGLYTEGGAGLEAAIGINLSLGPFTARTLHVALGRAADLGDGAGFGPGPGSGTGGIAVELSLSGHGRLGPFEVTLARVGVLARLSLTSGNMGPVDVDVGLKPPSGLGLTLNGSVVTGGGFLERDPATGRYVGAVMLGVNGTLLTAIGVIDPDVPELPSGYSFVIIVSSEFRPVRLGLGFTLNGVGGLAAAHRRLAIDPLRDGIRQGTVGSILFPTNPVANADRIVSDLDTIFPSAPGRYVVGPMALIGWGTPTMVEAEIGVILEWPEPVRLAILGEVRVRLPSPTVPIVDLRLTAIGTVDFAARRASLDATLHDSFIGPAPVTGDMAMRMAWGDEPRFALAIGGFHPSFPTPAEFPPTQRLAITLGDPASPTLALKAYLAVTSNSLQLGASAELRTSIAGFDLQGWLGFDALVNLSPFGFAVAVTAGLTLRRGGAVLAGIWVEATVSGPKPWHIHGRATVSALFLTVTVPIELTIGSASAVTVPPSDPRPLLRAAIEDPRSWAATLPNSAAPAVSVAPPPGTGAPAAGEPGTLFDPAGSLTIRQAIVPLNRKIDLFGATAAVGPDRYTLDGVTVDGVDVAGGDVALVDDYFAPAAYLAMSDAEKLSRPGFERMDAGFTLFRDAVTHGQGVASATTYDTVLLDAGGRRDGTPYRASVAMLVDNHRRDVTAVVPAADGRLVRYLPPRGRPPLVGRAPKPSGAGGLAGGGASGAGREDAG